MRSKPGWRKKAKRDRDAEDTKKSGYTLLEKKNEAFENFYKVTG
jgi:hypothetical protein